MPELMTICSACGMRTPIAAIGEVTVCEICEKHLGLHPPVLPRDEFPGMPDEEEKESGKEEEFEF